MSSNVISLTQYSQIEPLTVGEIENVEGGARVSNAGIMAGAAVWAVWTGAFTVGVSIGKDIGQAIFGKDND